jgi:hypothetical protein
VAQAVLATAKKTLRLTLERMIGSDLTPFFQPGEFAAAGDKLDGLDVTGIYDGAWVSTGSGMGMSDTRPVYFLPTTQVPAAPQGKILEVAAGRFLVADHQPDGTGLSMLILEFE